MCWRMRDSLSEQRLLVDLLTRLNPISDTWVCVKVRLCACGERQTEREGTSRREGAGAPWKQLQQHKMEFVSKLPRLCTSSPISL